MIPEKYIIGNFGFLWETSMGQYLQTRNVVEIEVTERNEDTILKSFR